MEMNAERFEELVADALDEIPEQLLRMMRNVAIVVEDDSPPDGPELLGLYEGVALPDRGWDYGGVLPDKISIFRNPILRICETEEDVVEEVAVTVVHEIAHHFGIDDAHL
ncbi:MAG TPA: metallopeptidase family protein, partial [Phytomonospora sp.]